MRTQRTIKDFYVLYRISDAGNIKNKIADKIQCLKNALNVFNESIFIIFADNVNERTNSLMIEAIKDHENSTIKYINCKSNPKSLRTLYEFAISLDDNDYVYFLEDDYLHLKNSFELIKEFAERNYTDYATLYDHPDKYEEGCDFINPYCKNFGEHTYVFRTQHHHWKITNSTTDTFAAFADVLKRDKDLMWKYTDGRNDQDFGRFIELYNNGIFLSSPIPSLSTHCEVGFIAPFVDWEKETLFD